MDRLITTHALRKTCSPSPMWTLHADGHAPVQTIVPGDAREIPGLRGYTGTLTYEKRITCAGTLRIILRGVDGHARLWLDDTLLSEGSGEVSAITGDVEYGQHLLRVIVTGGAGLIRPVIIEQMGGAYIAAVTATPHQKGRMWLAEVTVTVRSLCDEDKPIDLDITAAKSKAHIEEHTLPARGEAVITRTLPIPAAKRWSPAHPVLYPVSAVLWLDGEPCDDLRDRMGLCEAAYTDGAITVSGTELPGRILAREESCGGFGRAVPAQAAVRDAQLLRAMGVSAVHTGDDEVFLDACDELGLMVLAAKRLGNHPCVVVAPDAAQANLPLFADTLDGAPGVLDAYRREKA